MYAVQDWGGEIRLYTTAAAAADAVADEVVKDHPTGVFNDRTGRWLVFGQDPDGPGFRVTDGEKIISRDRPSAGIEVWEIMNKGGII